MCHFPRTPLLVLLVGLVAIGCGDTVGDPRDPFEVDPSPILGRWVERGTTDDPPREAVIEVGEGFLTGRFEFERSGLAFDVPFSEGSWDGERILFTTAAVFGTEEPITWTALLVPAEGEMPAILRFFPRIGGGVPFSVEYVRPTDAGTVARHPSRREIDEGPRER